jgi:hypothetical protein
MVPMHISSSGEAVAVIFWYTEVIQYLTQVFDLIIISILWINIWVHYVSGARCSCTSDVYYTSFLYI